MHATSEAQFAAANANGVPTVELVRDGLWALGIPMPGLQPHYSFSYLVADRNDGIHIIDPGWDSDENWQYLSDALASIGSSTARIRTVTVTHLHPDHMGMAERVRAETGAPAAIHRAEQDAIDELAIPATASEAIARFTAWGAPERVHPELVEALHRRSAWKPFTADTLLDDGDTLAVPGREIRVVHTPGHTTGHIALIDNENSLLFTGDLLLPTQFPGIGLGGSGATNPIDDYQQSLHRVARWADFEVLPGHGYRFTGLAERCTETAAHHDRRTDEVAAALETLPGSSVWDVASGLTWTDGWKNLRGLALLSALSQTATHTERALAR